MTIDDDVAKMLEKEIRRTGHSFKQVVNDTLRQGFVAVKQMPRKPFKVKPWNLQPPAGLNFDNIQELLDALDGPERP